MSETTLDQLIASLKSEAIDAAEQEAGKILAEARREARQLVQEAEKKRAAILSEAEREAQDIRSKGEDALRQAGRDYVISVRNELLGLFQAALEAETRRAFTPDLMKTAILRVIDQVGEEVQLKLPGELSEELAGYIQSRLSSSAPHVAIVEDNSVLSGFAIARTSEGWSYTISPEAVAEALNRRLARHWMDMLQNTPRQ